MIAPRNSMATARQAARQQNQADRRKLEEAERTAGSIIGDADGHVFESLLNQAWDSVESPKGNDLKLATDSDLTVSFKSKHAADNLFGPPYANVQAFVVPAGTPIAMHFNTANGRKWEIHVDVLPPDGFLSCRLIVARNDMKMSVLRAVSKTPRPSGHGARPGSRNGGKSVGHRLDAGAVD